MLLWIRHIMFIVYYYIYVYKITQYYDLGEFLINKCYIRGQNINLCYHNLNFSWIFGTFLPSTFQYHCLELILLIQSITIISTKNNRYGPEWAKHYNLIYLAAFLWYFVCNNYISYLYNILDICYLICQKYYVMYFLGSLWPVWYSG